MNAGYRALREGAAWLDLPDRGIIIATGRDRVRFLHNLTSNHIKQLTPGTGCYAFLLTPQGRIQCDANILCMEESFLLDTEPETRERLLGHLRKYIIADQVELEDASSRIAAIGIEGPQSAEVIKALGSPLPQSAYAHLRWNGIIVACISATGAPGFRIFTPDKVGLLRRLADAGVPAATQEDARIVRIENAKPRYGEEIFETTLPQETRQMHAIHFQKGCYLGQEIVERIRARGHVNKLLVSLDIDGTEPPTARTKLGDAGEIASAVYSPARGKVVALAYVRATHAEPGTVLQPGVMVAEAVTSTPQVA